MLLYEKYTKVLQNIITIKTAVFLQAKLMLREFGRQILFRRT